MSSLQDLMAKLAAIEESAKKSDIPAVQRKADAEKHGDKDSWKVTKAELDDEESEGKISHAKTLAKHRGVDESYEEEEEEVAEGGEAEAPAVAPVSTDLGGAGASDESIDECGDMDGDDGKQITMSMHDLIALVKGLQGGEISGAQDLFGGDEEGMGEEFGNSMPGGSDEFTAGIDAVTATGNDMHSKGEERPKVNGGGNPMQEALVQNLHALYARIKEVK